MTETTVAPTVETPKLTRVQKLTARADMLRKRIEADTASYNDIVAELEGVSRLANLASGDVVQVKLGRKFADKDTTRVVEAVVVGVKEDEDGAKLYKVQYGTGFDADIATVGAAQIILTNTVDPVAVEGDAPQA